MFKNVMHGVAMVCGRIAERLPREFLVRFLKRAYSYAVSSRFTKTGEDVFLEYPAITMGEAYVTLGERFVARARFRIEAYDEHRGDRFCPSVRIGDDVSFGYDCHVACINEIVIGSNVLVGSKVHITDHAHGDTAGADRELAPNRRRLYSKGPVVIEDNVWIGEGAVILPGVRVGRGAIVGANAVVTKDVPCGAVAVGVPAIVKDDTTRT